MAEDEEDFMAVTSTELNKALEAKDFVEAERLIKQNNDPEYLNKGPFGMHPLNLVLSGDSGYRNLYLAKLLIKEGANVNPYSQRTMVTPLELVVTQYLDVCAQSNPSSYFVESPIETIGLHRETISSPSELKKQLWEMIELLIAYGADPGIVMDPKVPCVFHTVVSDREPDMELVTKLFEAGGDFNKPDIHGNTPIMDLICVADLDAAWPVFTQILALANDLDWSLKNCREENVLWCAMLSGSPRIAIELVKQGVDCSVEIPVDQKPLSPLFAPLLQNSAPYLRWLKEKGFDAKFEVEIFNKVVSCCIYPVVDATDIHYTAVPVLNYLLEIITHFPISLTVSQEINEEEVALLMFGNLKAGLQQMCVRKIMSILVSARQAITELAEQVVESSENIELNKETSDSYVIGLLNPSMVDTLVKERLRLPPSLTRRFFVEAARLQIGATLFTIESPDCYAGCDGGSAFGSRSPLGYPLTDEEGCDDFDEDSDCELDWG